jgi:hypothetical protein
MNLNNLKPASGSVKKEKRIEVTLLVMVSVQGVKK